jgi:CrcB protein
MKGLEFALLAAGGLVGTFLRYKITESPIIFGTLQTNLLIVNIIGSFVLGLFFVMTQQWSLDTKHVLFVAVGFCGSLTTMSSFALETTNLLDNRQFSIAAINILANVGLSICAIFAGRTLMNVITTGGLR